MLLHFECSTHFHKKVIEINNKYTQTLDLGSGDPNLCFGNEKLVKIVGDSNIFLIYRKRRVKKYIPRWIRVRVYGLPNRSKLLIFHRFKLNLSCHDKINVECLFLFLYPSMVMWSETCPHWPVNNTSCEYLIRVGLGTPTLFALHQNGMIFLYKYNYVHYNLT